MKQHILHIFTALGLISWLLTACTDQEVSSPLPVPENGKIQMTMNIRDTSFDLPTTRASADESKIGDIYVFIFEKANVSENIDETATLKEVAKVVNTGTVRILELTETYTPAQPCNVLVIANPEDKIYYGSTEINLSGGANAIKSAIPAGTTLSNVCTNLFTEPLLESVVSDTKVVPFVNKKLRMAGVTSVSEIANSGTISVDLYRALAKITVQLKTGGIADFELLGITIINAPTQGLFWRLGNDLKDNSAAKDHLDYYYNGTTDANMLVDATAGSTANDPIYLYESRKEEKTSIIIKGKYNGDIGYFKLGLQEDNGTYMDIIRNTNYEITITDVNYRGFDNIQDAIKATSCQLDYTISSTEQGSHDIVSDGYMYLAFSNSNLEFYALDGSYTINAAFEILTNSTVDYNTNEISVESGNMTITSPGLTDGKVKVVRKTGADLGKTEIKLRLNSGFTKGTIAVKYGSLTHKLNIIRVNELWFKRGGGKQEIVGYYRGEISFHNFSNRAVIHEDVFFTPDGVGALGEKSIYTYNNFYLHVGALVEDEVLEDYVARQIHLYLSSTDGFKGRIKRIFYQSASE